MSAGVCSGAVCVFGVSLTLSWLYVLPCCETPCRVFDFSLKTWRGLIFKEEALWPDVWSTCDSTWGCDGNGKGRVVCALLDAGWWEEKLGSLWVFAWGSRLRVWRASFWTAIPVECATFSAVYSARCRAVRLVEGLREAGGVLAFVAVDRERVAEFSSLFFLFLLFPVLLAEIEVFPRLTLDLFWEVLYRKEIHNKWKEKVRGNKREGVGGRKDTVLYISNLGIWAKEFPRVIAVSFLKVHWLTWLHWPVPQADLCNGHKHPHICMSLLQFQKLL